MKTFLTISLILACFGIITMTCIKVAEEQKLRLDSTVRLDTTVGFKHVSTQSSLIVSDVNESLVKSFLTGYKLGFVRTVDKSYSEERMKLDSTMYASMLTGKITPEEFYAYLDKTIKMNP